MTTTSLPHLAHRPSRAKGDTLRRWLWAAMGPLMFGATLGLPGDLGLVAHFAIGLPVVIAASALLTVPTLFIALAYFKVGPSLAPFLQACAAAVESMGLVLAGLTPALLFLIATQGPAVELSFLAGGCFISVATIVALMGLYRGIVAAAPKIEPAASAATDKPTKASETAPELEFTPAWIFVPWAFVALCIGLHLFIKHLILQGAF